MKDIMSKKETTILFLCTGNSCRSQMAEGWAKALKKDEISFDTVKSPLDFKFQFFA